jgi:hypothetical protein
MCQLNVCEDNRLVGTAFAQFSENLKKYDPDCQSFENIQN